MIALVHETERVSFVLVQRLDRDLQGLVRVLDVNPNFGRQSRANFRGRCIDLDERGVLLGRRTPPVPRLRVLVYFGHFAAQKAIAKGVDPNGNRQTDMYESDSGLVNIGFDLHFSRVRKADENLILADRSPFLHDKLAAGATAADIGVDDLTGSRRGHHAEDDLLIDFGQLLDLFLEHAFLVGVTHFGRLDVAVQLR